MLADYKFSCPCDSENNTLLTGLVFSAPAFYILDKKEGKEEKRHNKKCKYCIDIILYLFPPILWIIMLLLDGDYIACSQTYWKGEYVLDDKLKIKWCKPTGLIPGRNENELQILTLSFINKSQLSALALLSVLCISVMAAVIYNDCKSRTLEQLNKHDEPTRQTSLSSSEEEVQHPSA
ncbi:hypothetical protein PO909_027578 [Leuciscus waleckii]